MKKLNKFLSGILSLAMAASCICTQALAGDYEAVTVDTDSIATIETYKYVGNSDSAVNWGNISVDVLTDASLTNSDTVTGTPTGETKTMAAIYKGRTEENEATFTIPLDVQTEGDYTFEIQRYFNDESGDQNHLTKVFLKVDNDDYIALNLSNCPRNDAVLIPVSTPWRSSNRVKLNKMNDSLHLTAGSHTLTFKADVGTSFGAIGDVILTPNGYLPATTITSDHTTTIAGGTYYGDWSIGNGGTSLLWAKPEVEGGYVFAVLLDVQDAGEYKLSFDAICSLATSSYHFSNVNIKIDDGDYEMLLSGTNITDNGSSGKSQFGIGLNNLSYNPMLNFTAGKHTIYFMADTIRSNQKDAIYAAIGDIKLTPYNLPTTVSGSEITVIPAGNYTDGCQVATDSNGNTVVGSCGSASTINIPINVEKTGYYKLSFDGLFNPTMNTYHFSKMRFAIDNGREAPDNLTDGTDYLIDGRNVTLTTPDADRKMWGEAIKNVAYNSYVKLTKGEHSFYFVVDEMRTFNGSQSGYYAVIGDITLEPVSDIVINAATDGNIVAGYSKSDTNGTIHSTAASSVSLEFEIFQDGWYEINAELMADMTGNVVSLSPVVFGVDDNAKVVLTDKNTTDNGDLGFGVTNWGNYYSYKIGSPIEFTAGIHTLTFSAESAINAEQTEVISGIRNIEINAVAEGGIESVEIDLPKTEVDFNPEENIIGEVVVTSDGKAVLLNNFKYYTFESSDNSVVEIDAYGELAVTGQGKATITFTAGFFGSDREVSASADIYVYEDGICVYDIAETATAVTAKLKTNVSLTGLKVYAAAYDKNVVKATAVAAANTDGVYEISVSSEGNTAKCFVWYGESGMVPVCEPISLK